MEVLLTLKSTSEIPLVNSKILPNRSSPDLRYLPTSDDGDRAIKNFLRNLTYMEFWKFCWFSVLSLASMLHGGSVGLIVAYSLCAL